MKSGSAATAPLEPVATVDGIEVSFSGVKVLKGVSFNVGAGRILGMVGENGAGKSTLMNVLGGIIRPDSGRLQVGGRPYTPANPNDARAAGIAFVHQELNLFPNLSIAENLFLTAFPRHGRFGTRRGRGVGESPFINRRRLDELTRERLATVGLYREPATLVGELPPGERQLVEIAKALEAQGRLIILDEPTTSLSLHECERLFSLLRQLRSEGYSMIYISHALGDVLRLCDDLVVLRDGEVVGGGPAGEFTQERLVSMMVGRQLDRIYPDRPPRSAREAAGIATSPGQVPALDVSGLTEPGVVRDISFSLDAGEVLGLSGLMGAGRSELARILFGLDPHSAGEIRIQGRRLDGPPRDRIRRGLAFLTEDRREEGLCMEASIRDNMALVTLPAWSRTPLRLVDFSAIKGAVARLRDALRLSPQAADTQPVRTLSGGNQQKVVLGKWLLAEPRVLILDEPTRGIDVGARFDLYQRIHRLADGGAAVLIISSEIEELLGLCDRILVLHRGELTAGFRRHEFDREKILAAALHASPS